MSITQRTRDGGRIATSGRPPRRLASPTMAESADVVLPETTGQRAGQSDGALVARDVLELQRTLGNQGVLRLLAPARPPRSGNRREGDRGQGPGEKVVVQAKLAWTAQELNRRTGLDPGNDPAYALVSGILGEYERLQQKSGDGPHLAVSLDRIMTAAERFLGRRLPSSEPQKVVHELYRDAANEKDTMAGIANVHAISPAYQGFVKAADPALSGRMLFAPAGTTLGKVVNEKPTGAGALDKDLYTTITADFGAYWGFAVGRATYFVPKADPVRVIDRHEKAEGELFPEPPRPEHVQQGKVGDCFLLAPAGSIAGTNPDHIRRMMKRNADDTVTVRFFEPRGERGRKSFVPRYYQVDASVLKSGGAVPFARGALWVQMIEKAFAASQLGTQESRQKTTSSYENIGGGQSAEAMEILLGYEVKTTALEGGRSDPQYEGPSGEFERFNDQRMPWSDAEKQAIRNAIGGLGPWTASVVYGLYGQDQAKTRAWLTFIETEAIADMVADAQKLLQDRSGRSFEEAVAIEDFEQLFHRSGLGSGVAVPILTYLGRNKLYPGRRGTGLYTEVQEQMYTDIRSALARRRPVTADTPPIISTSQTNTGQSANEPKGEGLVGLHSYSVLGVKTEGKVKYVQVRNPWGYYGRAYASHGGVLTPQAVEQGTGVSWVELGDFVKRFKQVHW